MAELHETMYGKRYYEHQLPELIKQLTRIADELREINAFVAESDENLKSNSDEKPFRSDPEF